MYSSRRRILSQNFLHDRKLVEKLLRTSSIGKNDTVIEIGPGKGIITEQLLSIAKQVFAIELDTNLCQRLRLKFKLCKNLYLLNQDFLRYNLPNYSYKIFANIPFSIEGKIIRKLLNAANQPTESHLIMRQDLAERLIGQYSECQFSTFYKPWFEFQIVHYFRKTDFTPYARMNTVLLRFIKREESLIHEKFKTQYRQFVSQGFGGGKLLKYNLRRYFTHEQFKRLARSYDFNIRSRPSDLNLMQWVRLFFYFQSIR